MYGKNKSKMVLQSNYVVVGRALFVALSKVKRLSNGVLWTFGDSLRTFGGIIVIYSTLY
jgi:hypothetical protein